MNKRGGESMDSESESQPLLSSTASQGSFGATVCMFPDSETSDADQVRSGPETRSVPIRSPRPFYASTPIRGSPPPPYQATFISDHVTNCDRHRAHYYSKLRTFPPLSGDSINKDIVYISSSSVYTEPSGGTQSSLVTIFSIWNTIIGSSILTMAWGLEKSGLIPGLIIILLVSGLCLFTSYTILTVSRDHDSTGYCNVPELCRMLLGRWAEYVAKVFSIVVLLGANIVYWVLMSNFLYHSVNVFHDGVLGIQTENITDSSVICPKYDNISVPQTVLSNITNPDSGLKFDNVWDLYSTVPVFLCFVMFPLLNFTSPTFFTKFNSLGTFSVMYLFMFVAVKAWKWGISMPPNWVLDELKIRPNFTALTGVLTLSYFIHNIIISIVRNNRYQKNNVRDLTIAYALCTFTYLFIGVLFYLTFPLAKSCIEDNILNNFIKYDPLTIGARVLLFFQLVTVYPLIAFMLRKDVLQLLIKIEPGSHIYPAKYVVLFNIVIVIICILIACFLPKIGTIIRFTGSLSGMVYVFTLPSLLKIVSLRKQQQLSTFKLVFLLAIPVIGFMNLISQFFVQE